MTATANFPALSQKLAMAPTAKAWYLALILLLAGVQPASAGSLSAAGFMADLNKRVVAQLAESGISESAKTERFSALLRESFDTAKIARVVTGPSWREADAGQQQAFLEAFEASIVARFLPLLSKDGGQNIVFEPTAQEATAGQRFVQVKSTVQRGDGSRSQLLWRLRKTAASFKIIDVSAEGISMAMTLRDEYAAVLNGNGGDIGALARMIRNKTASKKS